MTVNDLSMSYITSSGVNKECFMYLFQNVIKTEMKIQCIEQNLTSGSVSMNIFIFPSTICLVLDVSTHVSRAYVIIGCPVASYILDYVSFLLNLFFSGKII